MAVKRPPSPSPTHTVNSPQGRTEKESMLSDCFGCSVSVGTEWTPGEIGDAGMSTPSAAATNKKLQ